MTTPPGAIALGDVSAILPDRMLLAMLGTLRCSLHGTPEASGEETVTARIVRGFVANYEPDEIVSGLGGHGLAAVFAGADPGPTVVVRADLDAVRVEASDERSAVHADTRHVCGHDAHMAIVAGLAPLLVQRPRRGRIVLLFQPAEETGTGALAILRDSRFTAIRPDYAVSLHNLPGYPRHTVVAREGTFASASVGLQCELQGLAAHAAHPDQARSPSRALGRLLDELPALAGSGEQGQLVTVTHVSMGRHGFGVTPGRAELLATLRAYSNEDLLRLRTQAETLIRDAATRDGLDCRFTWLDAYPATVNDTAMVEALERVCDEADVPLVRAAAPFPWSDDFGHIAAAAPSVYFGLGIGVDAPSLHQPTYAFPDDVIATGLHVLHQLARAVAEGRVAVGRPASARQPFHPRLQNSNA